LFSPQHFNNGQQLLKWLARLPIANKNYQCVHYYYIFVTKPNVFPKPPSIDTINKIERDFIKMENDYEDSGKDFRSFFSYNWILRKLILKHNLDYFLQFIKPIKCKRRLQKYTEMYNEVTKLDNVVVTQESSKNCQILPVSPLDDEIECSQILQSFSNLLTGNRHYTEAQS
jgi:hypothetical protein